MISCVHVFLTFAVCEVQPCQNNGSCENVNGVYDCVCPKYFTGPLCETLNCDQNTDCSGNGHCNTSFDPSKPAGVSNSICLCERGYNGSNCEIDINECELFGGSKVCGLFPCLNKVGKYECDYCSGAKCQNGATCNPVNATDSTEVTCNCTAAYSGTFCEIEQCIGPVATCNGHGICKADRNTSAPAHVSANPLCLCFGYTGLRCDIFINFCTASPIYGKERCNSVNETCYAIEGGFQCGKPCESNPCFNGGTCAVTSTGIGFMCICPNGAAGLKCETIINPVVTSAHGSSTNTPASSQGLAPTSSSAVKVQITSSPSVLHSVTPTTSPLVVPSLPSAVVPSATAILLSTLFLSSTTVASAVVQIVPSSSTSTVSVPVSVVVQIPPSSSTSTVSVPVSASRSAATLLSTSFPFPTTVTSVVVQIPPSSSTSTVSVPVSASRSAATLLSTSFPFPTTVTSVVVQIPPSSSTSTVSVPVSVVVQIPPSSSTSTVSVPVSASRSAATLLSTSFPFPTTVTSVVVQIPPSSSTSTVSVPVSVVVQIPPSSSTSTVSVPVSASRSAATLLSTSFPFPTTVTSVVVQIPPSSSTSTVSVPVSAVVQIPPSSSTSTVSVPVSASRSAATLLSTSFPFPTTVTSVVVQIPPSSSTLTVSVPVSAVVQITPSSSTSTVSVPVSASRSAATLLSTSFPFPTTVTSVVVQIPPSSSTSTVSVPVSAVVQVTPSSSTSTVSVPVSASRSAATLLSTSFLFSTTVTSVVVQIEPSSSTVTVSVPVSASRSPVVSNESTTVTQGKVSGITPGTGGHDTTTAFLRTPVPSVQTGEVSGSGDSNTAVIIGVVVGCVVLIAVIIIILFVIALRSQSREGAYSPSQQETKGGASYRVELGNALLPPERERLI